MQVFGFFAARRIDDSLNIFKGNTFYLDLRKVMFLNYLGVHKSFLFLTIVVLVAGVQAILVEFGGPVVACSKYVIILYK